MFDQGKRTKMEQLIGLIEETDFDKTLILIGKEAKGPLTILDGNHRAVAMWIAAKIGRFSEEGQTAFVGLSPRMHLCCWCPQA
jgi:hypothetical protein